MSFLKKWFGDQHDEQYQRGMRAYDSGQYEEAITDLQACLGQSRDPGLNKLVRFYIAESYTHLALEWMKKEAYEKAVVCLDRALDLHPNFPDLYFNQAICFRALGNLAKQREALQNALAINPRYARAILFEGIALYEDGQPDAGLARIHEAVALDQGLNNERYLFALQCHHEGAFARAAANFRALENRDAQDANTHLRQGDDFAIEGYWEEAAQEYERAISFGPKYADIRCRFGTALLELGKLNEAIEQYRVALSINPRYADALAMLGKALQQVGDSTGAQESFAEALAVDPHHPIALQFSSTQKAA